MPPVHGVCVAIDFSQLDRGRAARPYQQRSARASDRVAVLEERLKRARAAREEAESRVRALENEIKYLNEQVESYQSLPLCLDPQSVKCFDACYSPVTPTSAGLIRYSLPPPWRKW